MQRWLIIAGLAILAAGLAWPWLARSGLGRLPGDVLIRRVGVTFYAPVVTCLVISAVLSLIVWLFRR
jgi:hypothetical protein